MPFAAALSEHPLTAYAIGEVCGQLLDDLGTHPDLVVIFTTLHHAGALEDVVHTATEVLHPSVVLGAASESIIGGTREIEGGPAVSAWAGNWGPSVPVRLTLTAGESTLEGLPDTLAFDPTAFLLLGDPYSFAAAEALPRIAERFPGVPVVGGMASGARGPGGTRLSLGDRVYSDGAVGVLMGPGADVIPLLSQGCRPIGRPFVVTDSSGPIIRELAGRPALERVEELSAELSSEEIRAVNQGGLKIGRVVDERKIDFGVGDFLVRSVLGGDRDTGAIAVDDAVDVGTTVQFHLRDAAAAHDDLEIMLSRIASAEPETALLFTCNGRGQHLFGLPDHDAELIADRLGPLPVAGMFAAGELGPVGDRNELHSFTASVLLLRDHRVPSD